MQRKLDAKIAKLVFWLSIILSILLSGCTTSKLSNLEGKTFRQTIKKYDHYVFNNRKDGPWEGDRIRYEVCFIANQHYDHGNNDNLDWNKLFGGFKDNIFQSHDLTIMNGWRKSQIDSVVEINFYNHGIIWGSNDYLKIANGAQFTNDKYLRLDEGSTCLQVKRQIQDTLVQGINTNLVITEISNGKETLVDSVLTKRSFGGDFYLSQQYFGGNKKAPDDQTVIITVMPWNAPYLWNTLTKREQNFYKNFIKIQEWDNKKNY